jgi:Uma2 family endonuclease
MLEELGLRGYTELTLEISDTWEPVPDVLGMMGAETGEVYRSEPLAAVVEILSPSDRFTMLDEKCRRYADWGVPDILVFDPVGCRAWSWDRDAGGLVPCRQTYRFSSRPEAELSLAEVFRRLELS